MTKKKTTKLAKTKYKGEKHWLWKKGGPSPNPSGRPAIVKQVQTLARERTPEAMQTIYDIMTNPNEPAMARLKGAEIFLNYGWGKAPQVVEVNKFDSMDVEDVAEWLSNTIQLINGGKDET